MNKFVTILSCLTFLVTSCFAETTNSQKRAWYQSIEQDSVYVIMYRQRYSEFENQYRALPVLDISNLSSLKHTVKSRTENSVFLVTPPIMDQFGYNTCTGWAVCYAAASIRLYEELLDMDNAKCSPQYLYNQYNYAFNPELPKDCRNSYSDILVIGNALASHGTCSYSLMPYDTTNCVTALTTARAVDAMNRRFYIQQVGTTNNIALFKQIIDSGRPIVVDMPVYDSFETMWNDTSKHGVWDNVDTTAHNSWSHATCIVGYDDTKEAFKVMNSKGDSLGDHGFYWAKYNVVQQGCFRRAIILRKQLFQEIEGPSVLTDSAWYYLRNVPAGATITWSLHNYSTVPKHCVIAQGQGTDSVYIALRPTGTMPPPIFPPLNVEYPEGGGIVQPYAKLTVTISAGTQTYTTSRNLNRPKTPSLINNMPHNNSYTLELWHSAYGLLRTQNIQSADEQIDTSGLPQGLYIIITKENGQPIKQTKIMIQ